MKITSWFPRFSTISLSIILSVTIFSGSANAFNPNLNTLAPCDCEQKPSLINPSFTSGLVRLGITPTGWSNSDDRTIDLNPPIPYRQILSEIALSGFTGTQMAPKFSEPELSLDVLKEELKLRNLVISEPWVSTNFTKENGKDQTIKEFEKQVEFMKQMNGNIIVVAETAGAVHQKNVDPLKNKPTLNDKQWKDLTNGLNDLGKIANENNMKLVYHPHIGTVVENLTDIKTLMDNTNPKLVNLLLDTGHLQYAGVDPLEVTNRYIDRIKHVHLKNVRQPVLEASKRIGRSFLNSIRAGIFTVPGTKKIVQLIFVRFCKI